MCLEDLQNEVIPLYEESKNDLSDEDIFNIYKDEDEFFGVPLANSKRESEAHRKQIQNKVKWSTYDEDALVKDRTKHPRKALNSKGEPVFDLDEEAKRLLRRDVKHKKHERMTPSELQDTQAGNEAGRKREEGQAPQGCVPRKSKELPSEQRHHSRAHE